MNRCINKTIGVVGGDSELDALAGLSGRNSFTPLPGRNHFGGERGEQGASRAGYCSVRDPSLRVTVEMGKSEQIWTYLGRYSHPELLLCCKYFLAFVLCVCVFFSKQPLPTPQPNHEEPSRSRTPKTAKSEYPSLWPALLHPSQPFFL